MMTTPLTTRPVAPSTSKRRLRSWSAPRHPQTADELYPQLVLAFDQIKKALPRKSRAFHGGMRSFVAGLAMPDGQPLNPAVIIFYLKLLGLIEYSELEGFWRVARSKTVVKEELEKLIEQGAVLKTSGSKPKKEPRQVRRLRQRRAAALAEQK